MPAFVPEVAFAGGPLQVFLHLAAKFIFTGIENRYVPADSLVAFVTINAFRTRVPGGNLSVHIQQEERIVLHPGRNPVSRGIFVRLGGLSLVTQQQEMADRQHVPFRGVLDIPRGSVWTQ